MAAALASMVCCSFDRLLPKLGVASAATVSPKASPTEFLFIVAMALFLSIVPASGGASARRHHNANCLYIYWCADNLRRTQFPPDVREVAFRRLADSTCRSRRNNNRTGTHVNSSQGTSGAPHRFTTHNRRVKGMKRYLLATAVFAASCCASYAQEAKPSYQADPDVYKVIFEDQNFRVISANWKGGATDKPHTHPVPSVIYFLTDCSQTLKGADSKTREVNAKAGTSNTVPVITMPHTAHNSGTSEC